VPSENGLPIKALGGGQARARGEQGPAAALFPARVVVALFYVATEILQVVGEQEP
jgi:hypothetical protein